jgi:hypothetical protein
LLSYADQDGQEITVPAQSSPEQSGILQRQKAGCDETGLQLIGSVQSDDTGVNVGELLNVPPPKSSKRRALAFALNKPI